MKVSCILLPLDGSEASAEAMEAAKSQAVQHNAKILVFGCLALDDLLSSGIEVSPLTFSNIYQEKEEKFVKYLHQTVESLKADGLSVTFSLSQGRATDEILKAVEDNEVDMIVMATHGRSGFQRFMVGSVTEGVLRRAPCPVLVVPCSKKS